MNQPVLDCMSAHASVREFKNSPLSDEIIEAAVAAAQCAATSSWIQAYRLIQVTRPKELSQLAALAGGQKQIEEAGAFFVICADTQRHRLILEDQTVDYANNFEVFLTSAIDASLFAQNLTLALESLGFGTCFIGAMRNNVVGVCDILELPIGIYPLFGLCVGVPAVQPETRPRLPVDAVWTKDRVPDTDVLRMQIGLADGPAEEHYASRGLPGRNWSGGILRRFRSLAREDLVKAYEARGALLR